MFKIDIVVTASVISPPSIEPQESTAIAEAYLHDVRYYLQLWNNVLLRNGSGCVIHWNPSLKRAVVKNGGQRIKGFDCRNANAVKSQYVLFRMSFDNFDTYEANKNALGMRIDQLAPENTSPSNMACTSKIIVERQRSCCIIQ